VKRRSQVRLIAAAAVIAAALVGVLLWPKSGKQPKQPAHSATAASSVASVQLVSITLRSDPPGAQLSVDGGPVTNSPLTLEVAADGRVHGVLATLGGYESAHRDIVFDHDQNVIISLIPLKVEPTTSPTNLRPKAAGHSNSTLPTEPQSGKGKKPKRTLDPSPFD
jgi:hypothetical protein